MGADFLMSACPMQVSKEDAKERLRKYDKEFVLNVLSDNFGQEFDDDEKSEYEKAIEWVDNFIDCVYGYWESGSRETTVYYFRGVPILVTGGLSWGDDPTDAYLPMSVVETLELTVESTFLTEHMKEWRKEQEKA